MKTQMTHILGRLIMENTIDAYLNSLPKEDRTILEELQEIINSVSNFEESIHYGMPGFKYRGKYVACFRMYKSHVGFYPCSGTILDKFSSELKKFKTSVGAVQFPKGNKLPNALIKKIIRARMNEIDLKLNGM